MGNDDSKRKDLNESTNRSWAERDKRASVNQDRPAQKPNPPPPPPPKKDK
jgi:hypothetical protein